MAAVIGVRRGCSGVEPLTGGNAPILRSEYGDTYRACRQGIGWDSGPTAQPPLSREAESEEAGCTTASYPMGVDSGINTRVESS